jgi:hypothetical protein
MTKQFIVRIGYQDYAIENADAVAILAIASRMKRVKQVGYSGPYYIQPDEDPWLDTVSMVEVRDPEPEPDKFSAATRDAIPF